MMASAGLSSIFGKSTLSDEVYQFQAGLAYFMYQYYFNPRARVATLRGTKERLLKEALTIMVGKPERKDLYSELARRHRKHAFSLEGTPFLIKETILFYRMVKNICKYILYLFKKATL